MRGSPRTRPDRGLIIVSIYTTEIKSEIASILFAINCVFHAAPMPRRSGGFLAAAPSRSDRLALGGIFSWRGSRS